MDIHRVGLASWCGTPGGESVNGSEDSTEDTGVNSLACNYIGCDDWLGAVPCPVIGRCVWISEGNDWLGRRIAVHVGLVLQQESLTVNGGGSSCSCAVEGMLSEGVGTMEGYLFTDVDRAGCVSGNVGDLCDIGHDIHLHLLYLLPVLRKEQA